VGALQDNSWDNNAAPAAALRVLIVDDSRLQRRILSAQLSRLGYEVRECESGIDALDVCEDWPPDLVLSDWMMPGMDGLEFCQKFKAMPREGYGYFILLTSKSAKDEVAEGLENGADDFLTKPVNGHELRARLAAGERIVNMQRELIGKNKMISETLSELQDIHESLNNDLIEAKKLQQSLVREKFKELPTADVSFLLRSSGHVGGDLVGYFPISDDKIGLFAIDVSGHGISSALMTARLAGHLTSPSPEQNTLCQAGHPHPLVQRMNGAIEQDGTGGLPVGLFPDVEFEQFEIQLAPGDRLVLSSDGITECPASDEQMLGEEGFEALMKDLEDTRGPVLLETLVWMLADFAGDAGFPDDISAVLFEFQGRSGKPNT